MLAIDTSSNPGFALYTVKDGVPTLVAVDSVKTTTDFTDSERYAIVEAKTIQVIHAWGPFDMVCREHFTKGGSKRGTQLVFGSWAAVDVALGRFGYHIPSHSGTKYEVTNSRVKSLVGKAGAAKKKAVDDGIREILGLPDTFIFANDDESDAAAIGYTFLYDKGLIATDTTKTGVDDDEKADGKTT